MSSIVNSVWVERYRPKTVEDCILPDRIKKYAKAFVESGKIPHLILAGQAGTGKTTLAKALCKELNYEVMFINGSLDMNLATLREDITSFASALSFEEKRKCIIIDEADYMSSQVMGALRSQMETLSANCSFILTCNFPNRLMDAIISRCSMLDFALSKDEHAEISGKAFKRVIQILTNEGVTFDKQVIGQLLLKYYPDLRKVINELQRYSAVGAIDSGIFASALGNDVTELMGILKEKNFSKMRKWVASSPNLDITVLCRSLYDKMPEFLQPQQMPQALLHLHDYSYKSNFVADKELNVAAMLTHIMMDM